ncbi:Protein saf4 [Sorochytrium milnesiophthora]
MQPFNKYFPPDFDPKKHNSVNQHIGKHPLGDRARKLKSHGVLVVRFELPFNIWCLGCNNHIGMGVRYNAEKKKIGNYYSTPILSFRMKCHLCDNWFEIQTDPQNTQYVVTEGAKQKVEEYDPDDAEVPRLKDDAEKEKLAENGFYRLEHAVKDAKVAQDVKTSLMQLKELTDEQWEDDFTLNQKLRTKFRRQKKADAIEAQEGRAIAQRIGTSMAILPETEEDRIRAKLAQFSDKAQRSALKRKLAVQQSSIFDGAYSASNKKAVLAPARTTRSRLSAFRDNLATVKLARSLPGVVVSHQPTSSGLVAYESSDENP